MPTTIKLVCSNKARPSVQSNSRRMGHQWWKRDVFHADAGNGRTLCGVNAADWLKIETLPVAQVVADDNFCARCKIVVRRMA